MALHDYQKYPDYVIPSRSKSDKACIGCGIKEKPIKKKKQKPILLEDPNRKDYWWCKPCYKKIHRVTDKEVKESILKNLNKRSWLFGNNEKILDEVCNEKGSL